MHSSNIPFNERRIEYNLTKDFIFNIDNNQLRLQRRQNPTIQLLGLSRVARPGITLIFSFDAQKCCFNTGKQKLIIEMVDIVCRWVPKVFNFIYHVFNISFWQHTILLVVNECNLTGVIKQRASLLHDISPVTRLTEQRRMVSPTFIYIINS